MEILTFSKGLQFLCKHKQAFRKLIHIEVGYNFLAFCMPSWQRVEDTGAYSPQLVDIEFHRLDSSHFHIDLEDKKHNNLV
jgi:hypothetical protein